MEHSTGIVLVLTLLLFMEEGTVRERERRRKTASPDTAQVSVPLFPCCCVYQMMKVEAILVESELTMSKADSLILLLYCNMLMAHHLQQTWQTLVSMQLLSLTIITCTVVLSVTVCSCCPSPLSHALLYCQ